LQHARARRLGPSRWTKRDQRRTTPLPDGGALGSQFKRPAPARPPAGRCRLEQYVNDRPYVYGPEYTRERHLTRLRDRAVGRKRALALRELAPGVEALERFVEKEPLRRVHECVFGVLALESEPLDPRL
jgi:PNKP (polynucleotide 5'-kinase/3'-phosphatase) family adenylyltransferase-like protein